MVTVQSADYYDSGAVKSGNVAFGWNTASATSRIAVITKRMSSAGESGPDRNYGDFTVIKKSIPNVPTFIEDLRILRFL